MSQTTLLLTQMFGIYLTVMGIVMLIGRETFSKRVISYMNDEAASLLGGIVTLIMGIILVTFHNMWVLAWPLVITVLCWWVLIKGALLLLCPHIFHKFDYVLKHHHAFNLSALFTLFMGLIFLHAAFWW